MLKKIPIDDLKSLIEKIRSGSDDQKSTGAETFFAEVDDVIGQFSKQKSNDEKEVIGDLLLILSTNPTCHKFAAHVDPGGFKQFGKEIISTGSKLLIPAYLDIFRSPNFLTRIYDDNEWSDLILNLLKESNYTFPKMFFHRTSKYRNEILFTILEPDKTIDYSWTRISKLVTSYSRGLLALLVPLHLDKY